MPDMFSALNLDAMLGFVFANIFWFVGIGIGIYILVYFIKVGFKSKTAPINRSEVERIKFIERLKNNDSTDYVWLKRGNKLIGKIMKLSAISLEQEKHANQPVQMAKVYQLVIKPALFSHIRMANPFAKTMAIQLACDLVASDIATKTLVIPSWVYLDYYFGIYYDKQTEEIHTAYIKHDNLMRSDLNMMASIYFAKSQEQATFAPDHAHELAMKEKEIQVEMAKRQGKITSI